jgi:hypothetical protein
LYKDINLVEAYIGGLCEDIVSGFGDVGPLMKASLKEQYLRFRDGDPYFYQNPGVLDDEEIAELKDISMGSLILKNTAVSKFPINPFMLTLSSFYDPNACSKSSNLNSVKFSTSFQMNYTINSEKTEINFTVVSTAKGWFAFGFGSSMASIDGFMFQSNSSGYWIMKNMFTTGYGIINIREIEITTKFQDLSPGNSNTKIFSFIRPLVPAISTTKESVLYVKLDNKPQSVAFAFSDKPYSSYHESNRGIVDINFYESNSPDIHIEKNENLGKVVVFVFHGIVMSVLFLVLFPIGILVARYHPNRATFVTVHKFLMSVVVSDVCFVNLYI